MITAVKPVVRWCDMRSSVMNTEGNVKGSWMYLAEIPIYCLTPATPSGADRRPLVLLPGFLVSSRYLEPVAELLASDFPTYVPDLPGFGRSPRSGVFYDLTTLANLLDLWMSKMELQRATFIGPSFGSQIAVEFAVRYPHRVDSLVLAGPTMDPRGRSFLKLLWRVLLHNFRETPSARMLREYVGVDPRWVFHLVRVMLGDRIEEKLPHVQAPTLVVGAAKDVISPQRWVEEAARLLPRGSLEIIPGASHSIMHFWIEEFVQRVTPFLQEDHLLTR
jgi:2-hydroxy-6-oxonona-2,4-dienedioate hydrolase